MNHIIHRQNRVIDVLEKLKIKKIISEVKYEDSYPVGSSPAVSYGHAKNPKLVEDGVPPFWSILSALGKPTYKLSIIFCTIINTSNFKWIYNQRFIFICGRAFLW